MFDFYEKRKIKSLLYSKATLIVLAILIVLLARSVYERYQVAEGIEDKREAKVTELAELNERAKSLEEKVSYLENERGMEEEFRGRFDVAKEGEQVVIIVDKDSEKIGSTSGATEDGSWFDIFLFWR